MRNRYLDLLRAAAIIRVIVYHLFGWPWLTIVLPAMGVMFALAGSLTAASLEKRPAKAVVASRLRRLLPPLWLLGLLAVPAMIALGWPGLSIPRLLFWIFPLGDPPGSDQGVDAWEPLWYIRAYVWFVLLSPALYALYRRVGWLTAALPVAAVAVLDKTGFSLPDVADSALWDFVTYGACWIVGFAHHDGRLRRANPSLLLVISIGLGGAALYWQNGHQGETPWDLNDVPESQALWSLAFVLFALQFQPAMHWLRRARPLDRLVDLLNGRAVTIYLWHNIAIAAVWPVLTWLTLDDLAHGEDEVELAGALLLTLVAVIAFGWVEDLAARRRPRLLPPAMAPRPADPAAGTSADARPTLVGAPPPARTALLPSVGNPPSGWPGVPNEAHADVPVPRPYQPPPAITPQTTGPGGHRRADDDEPPGRHAADGYGTHRDLPVAGRPAFPAGTSALPPVAGRPASPGGTSALPRADDGDQGGSGLAERRPDAPEDRFRHHRDPDDQP